MTDLQASLGGVQQIVDLVTCIYRHISALQVKLIVCVPGKNNHWPAGEITHPTIERHIILYGSNTEFNHESLYT